MDNSFKGSSFMASGSKPRLSTVSISGRKHLRKNALSGRHSASTRSNQSVQIIAKSDQHIVECYGYPLPVLVNEALTFSERNTVVSVLCSQDGWAWAVCGRRLLVWQYKDRHEPALGSETRIQRRTIANQCRELTLPHCDIGHKASLVTVFSTDGQQMPACLAVSPTGDVRFWPSIAHDGSSIDEVGIMEGQEFDDIISVGVQGYLLATTTCNLVQLQLQVQGGRHVITHKTIKPPSGFFSGIGRKFASIIIGMNHSHEKENKLIKVCTEKISSSEFNISILSDRWIQRWAFVSNTSEQFLYEDHELMRKVRDHFHKTCWSFRDINEIEVWFLDMQSNGPESVLLCAAFNPLHTPQMLYAFVTVTHHEDRVEVKEFTLIKQLTTFYSHENEQECLGMKFILNRNTAYVYVGKTIYPVYFGGNEDFEKIDLHAPADKILFAASYHQFPLFFTRHNGLVCVTPSDFDGNDFMNSSMASEIFGSKTDALHLNASVMASPNVSMSLDSLAVYDLDPEEICNDGNDAVSQTKAAFIYYLKKNISTCNGILKSLFPGDVMTVDSNSLLDKTVSSIVKDLADDIPASDPRWEQAEFSQKQSLGSSTSMQIIQQLKDKSQALNCFIDFLHGTKLWNKLSAVTYKGSLKPTHYVISDIYEQIIAAITLKSVHTKYQKLIDEAIDRTLEDWNQPVHKNLTQQDVFYVRVTQIQDFFHNLTKLTKEIVHSEVINSQISAILIDADTILLTTLKKVSTFRDSKKNQLTPPDHIRNQYDYLSWTATSGNHGLKDSIVQMIQMTLKNGARSTGEPEVRQQHYIHLYELIDYFLDGRVSYLDSIKENEEYSKLLHDYESERTNLLQYLVDDEQFDLAAKLGEKYLDFQTLVVLCDRTKNQSRLDDYIERFKNKNFSQFAIQWHIVKEKKADLFERFKGNQVELSKFLTNHPSLAWVQNIFNGNYRKASETLFELALAEREYVARKKTILSLSKLAALATEGEMRSLIEEINVNLQVIGHQEQLSEIVLRDFGYDVVNPKVMPPEEIIHIYISEENKAAYEFEFRKALELVKFTEVPLETRHKIWCAAILRDSWVKYDAKVPLNAMKNTLFFKLAEMCLHLDGDLEYLPAIEDFLTAPELGALIEKKSFQYLLKLIYEYLFDTNNKSL